MKLRVRGDSIRLRLSKKEVAEIREGRAVHERVRFPGGGSMTYALAPGLSSGIHARFTGELLEVGINADLGRNWANSAHQISLEAGERLDDGSKLAILIEKDFFCRSPRSRPEDESDLFPNPNHGCGG